ncbi:MAG: hypothetical protein WAV09_00880 [Minisyncoccia bacterium]
MTHQQQVEEAVKNLRWSLREFISVETREDEEDLDKYVIAFRNALCVERQSTLHEVGNRLQVLSQKYPMIVNDAQEIIRELTNPEKS